MAIMKEALTKDELRPLKSASPSQRALIVCYIPSKDSRFTLSQLRCLYLAQLHKQSLISKNKLFILTLCKDAVVDSNGIRLEQEEVFELASGCDKDEIGEKIGDSDSDDHSAVKVGAQLLANHLVTLMSEEVDKIITIAPISEEYVVNDAKRLLSQSRIESAVDFEIILVNHVTPDEEVKEAWKKKHELVSKISKKRLFSSSEEISSEKVNLITLSSLKFDLLKKSRKLNVFVARKEGQCDQKAGSFLQYNCARICSLLNQFDELVEQGAYPRLPSFEEGASLPTDQQEWELVFKYLHAHDEMISEVQQQPDNCHKLIQWLICFSHDFSAYYNRIHILSDQRSHLYPKMFARIRLLLKLKKMLEFWLGFLDLPLLTSI